MIGDRRAQRGQARPDRRIGSGPRAPPCGQIGLQQTAPGLERKQFGAGPAREEIEQQAIARASVQALCARALAQRHRHARAASARMILRSASRSATGWTGELLGDINAGRRARLDDALHQQAGHRRARRCCARSPVARTAAATTAVACPAQSARSGSPRESDRPFAPSAIRGRDRSRRTEICIFAAAGSTVPEIGARSRPGRMSSIAIFDRFCRSCQPVCRMNRTGSPLCQQLDLIAARIRPRRLPSAGAGAARNPRCRPSRWAIARRPAPIGRAPMEPIAFSAGGSRQRGCRMRAFAPQTGTQGSASDAPVDPHRTNRRPMKPLDIAGFTPQPPSLPHVGSGAERAKAEDTIKIGILHSLSGTMAISETILKDLMLMQVAEHQRQGRPARQEDRAGRRRSRVELAAVRRKGARTARQGQGRGRVRLLDLGVAQIRAAGVRGTERAAVLPAGI